MTLTQTLTIDPIDDVVAAFSKGRMVIIADDVDRENEGDLVIATEALTPEHVAFMATYARGLICVTISTETSQRLELPFQVSNNNSPFHTPFTLSIDLKSNTSEGVTSRARTLAMKSLIDTGAKADDFVSPGHVFPLIAHPSGVFGRRGQTEASYDLARICNLSPSGVICEILNDDGTMARGADLNLFAQKHQMLVTTVAEIIKYRIQRDILAHCTATCLSRTVLGECKVSVYEDEVEGKEHLLVEYGDISLDKERGVLVRIHSECLTGDVFGSRRCDCGPQLQSALELIKQRGQGIVLYLRQEGRGIGLMNKLKAYALQDGGADTVEANLKLGFEADRRDFAVAANILSSLNIRKISLMTNNPRKMETMKNFGLEVAERIPLVKSEDPFSRAYLETKRSKLGHLL